MKRLLLILLLLPACSSSGLSQKDKEDITNIIIKTCQNTQDKYLEEMKTKHSDFKDMAEDVKKYNPCHNIKL